MIIGDTCSLNPFLYFDFMAFTIFFSSIALFGLDRRKDTAPLARFKVDLRYSSVTLFNPCLSLAIRRALPDGHWMIYDS